MAIRQVLNDKYLSFNEGEDRGWEKAELPPTPYPQQTSYNAVIQSEAMNLLNFYGHY